jgi:hypothetical protein
MNFLFSKLDFFYLFLQSQFFDIVLAFSDK